LLDSGIVPMEEPETHLTLEAPGGLVRVRALCRDGKAERIFVRNLPSFADKIGVPLEVPGLGTLSVDTAYGGDSFVVVDAADAGFEIVEDEAGDIARTGMRIAEAANEQLGFVHPENPDWKHISFCAFCGPLSKTDTGLSGKSAVAIRPGKVDRSPTGTAVSARMALMAAKGQMTNDQTFEAVSIIGSRFAGRIVGDARVGDRAAILPEISGRAWITGVHQHMLDPDDPWPGGYRLSDTWGA
ncbi:MAG: proline racemase family protein, partial [Silicimonas sp.]|nr:proline racemase family protein [Silicimonas sp.]